MPYKSLQERLEAKAEAETVQLEEGDYLEGIVFDVEYVDNLGGYKGRTPILYLETENGPQKFFAMHLLVKNGVVSSAPQGGDRIGIVRGPDEGEGDGKYRTYHVAVEHAQKDARFLVFDWNGTRFFSEVERQEAKRLNPDDDLPF